MAPALADSSPLDEPLPPASGAWVCSACGCAHRPAILAAGEKAACVRCGTFLREGSAFRGDGALAFAVTGLILAVPAMTLPFVSVSKLAHERVGVLFSGVSALWGDGMRLLSVWVLICGGLAPLLLLGTLVTLLGPVRLGWRTAAPRRLAAIAHAIEHWSMPEVHVLAVLVALVKLHTLVGVSLGLGFWCYIGMSFVTLLAWRNFDAAASLHRSSLAAP